MRINISMDEDLIKKVDEVATKMHVSRSSYIAFAVSQKIQNDEILSNMPEILRMLQAMQTEKKAD